MNQKNGVLQGMLSIAVIILSLCWVCQAEAATVTSSSGYWQAGEGWSQSYTGPGGVARLVNDFNAQNSPYIITQAQAEQLLLLSTPGNEMAGLNYLESIYVQQGWVPPNSAALAASRNAGRLNEASNLTANTVMHHIALPAATTKKEKEDQDKAERSGTHARLLDAQLRYEHVNIDDSASGNVYGASLGYSVDTAYQTSYGVIVPYDYARIQNTDIHRLGAILFGQYHMSFTDQLQSSITLDLPFTQLNVQDGGKNLNTFGAGAGVNLVYDTGMFVPSLAVQYQYAKDDRTYYDYHNLFLTGLNIGFRVGEMLVLNGFCIWNHDASAYLSDINGDTDYFDVGAEVKYTPTGSFTLSLGYKKILGLDHVTSDMLYLGALGHF